MLVQLAIDHNELKKLQKIGNFKGDENSVIASTIHDIIYQRFEEWENFDEDYEEDYEEE